MELPGRLLGKITRKTGRAISDFKMISEGDMVLVALSGGKSALALLYALENLRSKSPVRFTLSAITLHPPGCAPASLAGHCQTMGISHLALEVPSPGDIESQLFEAARRGGFNKVALGHNADDLIETLLVSEFFEGEIKTLPPFETAGDGVAFIRPLCRVFEKEILDYNAAAGFPCEWTSFSGTPPDSGRVAARKLLERLEGEHGGIKANLLSSLGRVRERYLLLKK
jgi:tRNA 2-thiocytidine biosynthesis protein TtcA